MNPDASYGLLGFSAGVDAALQTHPANDDLIMTKVGVKDFGLPLLHVAVGLPYNVDVMAHGLGAEGVTIFGGGLRYGVYKSGILTPFLPSVVLAGNGDDVSADQFSATHYSFDATASWDLPFINPFIGVGYDHTTVEALKSDIPGQAGLSAGGEGSRLAVGADLKPLPFVRVRGAYMLLHGIPAVLANVGVTF
jgi:hypothetical protein